MAWRVAQALDKLKLQVDALAPHRSKVSDGTIGDAAHASRSSDHNPWIKDGNFGVVSAEDFTHDPKGGFDAYKFAEVLRLSQDERIKYVISNRRIFSGTGTNHPAWTWRPYSGANPHDHHTHVSVKGDKVHYDSGAEWSLGGMKSWEPIATPNTPLPSSPIEMDYPRLRLGAKGSLVSTLQNKLNQSGAGLKVDGDFGQKTLSAVRAFQESHDLLPDGKVGKATWAALEVRPEVPTKPIDSSPFFSAPFPPISPFGLEWGRKFERFSPKAYPDPTPAKAAQGYGHNASSGIPPVPKIGGEEWTEEFAEKVYANDVSIFARYLNAYVKVPLTQDMIDALTLDVYNLGPKAFREDKAIKVLNEGDYLGAWAVLRNRLTTLKGLRRRYNILADIAEGKKPKTEDW